MNDLKYMELFDEFLNEDLEKDYYYKLEHTYKSLRISNTKATLRYELFVKNLDEIEDETDKDNIIYERFFNFLDSKNLDYDFEDVLFWLYECIDGVIDVNEYIGDSGTMYEETIKEKY